MDIEKIKEASEKGAPSFANLTDLAAERLDGSVLFATDDFFAEKENLIKEGRGIFIPDKYTDRGKWMDGWESRRKRTPGHDWCIVKLAAPGKLKGFDIDTNHFLGNHPPFASVEGILLEASTSAINWEDESLEWEEILPKSPLDPGSQNFHSAKNNAVYSHLRLHIYPDGGVARFRAYGEIHKDWTRHNKTEEIDLVAAINGGLALKCNDMFFSNMKNLIMPGRGINMGDGWETKRNRTPNNRDWVILKLATPGKIHKMLVDTIHFKGNYPDACSIEACYSSEDDLVVNDKVEWQTILQKQKLQSDSEHLFIDEILENDKISHIRLNIFPDGGVSRLRVFGVVV